MSSAFTNQKIAEAIRKQVSTKLGAEIGAGFVVIRAPSGFAYSIRYGASAYWNPDTLALFDKNCELSGDGVARVTTGSFSTLFANILANSTYVTSTVDAQTTKKTLDEFSDTSNQLVTAFESDFGEVTQSHIGAMGSKPPTKTQYIADYVAKNFPGDPPSFPPSMAVFESIYASWVVLSRMITRNAALKADALDLLSVAQAHVKSPNAENGGLQTDVDSWSVAYEGLPDNATLQAELSDTDRAVTISLVLDNMGDGTLALTSDHQSLGVMSGKDLKLTVTDAATEQQTSLDPLFQTSSRVEMKIQYQGLAIVSARPMALSADHTEGWYSRDALIQIADKSGKDETGIQLANSTYSVDELFGPGKRLNRVKTFVISEDPTITLDFHGGAGQQVLPSTAGDLSATVELGQITRVGENVGDYKATSSTSGSGVVSVVIVPSRKFPTVTVPAIERRAHIIGGIVDTPP